MQNSDNTKTNYPNVLLIAGQQQNVGKTTLVSKIISHFTWTNKITGIKVTPHFHENTGDALVIEKSPGYQILKETTPDSDKDTSIMLMAGAEEAYLLEAEPEFIKKGFWQVMKYVPDNNLVVCESAGLIDHIEPGVFFALKHIDTKIDSMVNDEQLNTADRIITFTGNKFDFSLEELKIESSTWKILNKKL